MNMKRILTVLLTLGISISFSGCQKENAKKGEIPTITWNLVKPIENMTSKDLVEKELNSILRERVGAELKLNLIESGAWKEKMNLIISSGEEFDITMTNATGPVSLAVNAKRGAFLDITDLYKKYGSAIAEKVDKRAIDAATIDGKLMLIPSQGKFVQETAYVFKKDLVEKYGFDYKSVTCLEDLEPYLETIKQNEPGITPLYITAVADLKQPVNKNYSSTVVAGVYFDEVNEKFIPFTEYEKDEYKLKNNYYKKGYIAKDAFTKQDSTEGKNGKYAVLRDTGAHTEDSSKATDFYGFPTVETLVGTSIIEAAAFTNGNAISVTSKHPDKAMQILNEVWADTYVSNTLAYGVEGVDYKVVGGTTNDDKSVLPNSGSEQKWVLWHNWIGPLFDQWDSTWNSKESLEKMEHDNNTAPTSKICGFIIDVSDFDAEIAAISEVINSSQIVFRVSNEENFDTYYNDIVKKLEKAGINDVLDKLNSDYAAWKKSKN